MFYFASIQYAHVSLKIRGLVHDDYQTLWGRPTATIARSGRQMDAAGLDASEPNSPFS